MEKETVKNGFGLIEIIFCSLLIAIISMAGFNILRQQFDLKRLIYQDKEAREKADFFFQLLENYFQQANILFNIQGMKIHPQSKILDQNNTLVAIGKSSPKIRVNSKADAISFLILKTEAPLENISINQRPEKLELCLSNYTIEENKKSDLTDDDYFYALYLNGQAEIKGKLKKINQKSEDCRDGYLYNFELRDFPKSIFSDKNPTDIPLIAFPIEESFTFYLDNNKTLRRFSVLTGENQPLITKVSSLKIVSKIDEGINKITVFFLLEQRNPQEIVEFTKEFFLAEKPSSSYYDLVL